MESFADIMGQEQAIFFLTNSLENEQVNHAYLFWGSAGIGKRSTARIFAKQIIARSDAVAELYFKQRMHPDLLILQKPEDKNQVLKEQITKELESWLAIKPFRARNKVVIIEDAHLLSDAAGNALLKILEEPPEYAVIILVADENTILETIISRCQIVRFALVNEKSIIKLLTKKGIAAEEAAQIASLCQGNAALALEYSRSGREDLWEKAVQIVIELSAGNRSAIFKAAGEIEKKPLLLLNLLQAIMRDILIYQKTGQEELLLRSEVLPICKVVLQLDEQKVYKAWQEINSYRKFLRSNINISLLSLNIAGCLFEAL